MNEANYSVSPHFPMFLTIPRFIRNFSLNLLGCLGRRFLLGEKFFKIFVRSEIFTFLFRYAPM